MSTRGARRLGWGALIVAVGVCAAAGAVGAWLLVGAWALVTVGALAAVGSAVQHAVRSQEASAGRRYAELVAALAPVRAGSGEPGR